MAPWLGISWLIKDKETNTYIILYDIDNNTKVYVFENVNEYKDELCDILEENKLSYLELENLIKSWGGKVDLVPISLLVKNYFEKKYW